MLLLCHPKIQFHATVTALAGPVKVSDPAPLGEQSLWGMLNCTGLVCPDCNVPLDGLMTTLLRLLEADHFKLRVFELLVSETEHSHVPPVGSSLHCRLAKMGVDVVVDRVGADITVSVTCTVNVPAPILNVTFPV